MREVLNFIRPPEDADWKHLNRWRWNVCLTLLVLVVGGVGALTPYGFARAGDIDKKIAAALEPVAKEQKEQRVVLNRVNDLLADSLAEATAAKIRLNISKRCKATTFAERDELTREKDKLQKQYETYAGERYTEPSCGEL